MFPLITTHFQSMVILQNYFILIAHHNKNLYACNRLCHETLFTSKPIQCFYYCRDSATSNPGFMKKLYQKRDRKSSLTTPTKTLLRRTDSPGGSNNSEHVSPTGGLDKSHKFISATNLSDTHTQASPFYTRRGSNASPNVSNRSVKRGVVIRKFTPCCDGKHALIQYPNEWVKS